MIHVCVFFNFKPCCAKNNDKKPPKHWIADSSSEQEMCLWLWYSYLFPVFVLYMKASLCNSNKIRIPDITRISRCHLLICCLANSKSTFPQRLVPQQPAGLAEPPLALTQMMKHWRLAEQPASDDARTAPRLQTVLLHRGTACCYMHRKCFANAHAL